VALPDNAPPAVLLGGAVTALSVARSLGRAGIPVTILSDGVTDCLARRSRYCRRYVHFEADAGTGVKAQWLQWLERDEAAVVLPCSDEGVELVARHRDRLGAAGHRCIEAADEVLLAMLDKQRTYERAAALGVVSPRTFTAHTRDDASGLLGGGLAYPFAVKPTRSDALVRRVPGIETPKGTVVRDESEFDAALEVLFSAGVGALITEIIPGDDSRFCSYYSYLDEHGEPLLHFTKRKTRQYPIAFGLGTYHVTEWQPDVAEVGLRLFQGMGLRGLGNVEFKRDERDGELKLIECNPRFTMANELARRAGIDFGLVAYNRVVGRALPDVDAFRDGLHMWFPLDDLRALRAYRAAGQLTTAQWVRSLAHVQHFPTFQWRDPVPSLVGARGWLRRRPGGRRGGDAAVTGVRQDDGAPAGHDPVETTTPGR